MIALFLVSIVMAFFLFFILGTIYDGDIEKCKFVDYEITKKCISENSIRISIKNNFNETIDFKINGKSSLGNYRVKPKETKKMSVSKGPSSLTFLPILSGSERDYECNGKIQVLNAGVITKCIKD